jgi:hypothetical protein
MCFSIPGSILTALAILDPDSHLSKTASGVIGTVFTIIGIFMSAIAG